MDKFISPFDGIMKKGNFGAKTKTPLQFEEVLYASTVQVAFYASTEKKITALIKKILGVNIPAIGEVAVYAKGRVQWAGANRLQIVSSDKALLEKLTKDIPVDVASIIELSHSRGVINIKGETQSVLGLLAKGASVDFKGDDFIAGSMVLTNMAHIGVAVDCIKQTKKDTEVNVFVYNTFAKSFYHFLLGAGEEFGVKVKAK